MRITREYVFDMIELVGKAVQTARKKEAGPEWDMDYQIQKFCERHELSPLEQAIKESVGIQYEDYDSGKAKRAKHDFGDAVSCELWAIQRELSFKMIGTQDAIKRLQSLCNRLARFISAGWGTRLANIIDTCARG
jgi:regulator of RNase E activity RraB